MLSYSNLLNAFKKVKASKGAAGIDGQSIDAFAKGLETNLTMLLHELRTKEYRPHPVKRVEIPKPDGGLGNLGFHQFGTELYSRR